MHENSERLVDKNAIFLPRARELSALVGGLLNNEPKDEASKPVNDEESILKLLKESLNHSSFWREIKNGGEVDGSKRAARAVFLQAAESNSSAMTDQIEMDKLVKIQEKLVPILRGKADVVVGTHVPENSRVRGVPYIEIVFSPSSESGLDLAAIDALIVELESKGDDSMLDRNEKSTTAREQAKILRGAKDYFAISAPNLAMSTKNYLRLGGLNEELVQRALPFFPEMKKTSSEEKTGISSNSDDRDIHG